MKKKYYEIVLEGHYNAIYGLLKGFLLGKNQDWTFYFSKKDGIRAETLGESIREWINPEKQDPPRDSRRAFLQGVEKIR
jgi:hypothetical protein